MLKKIIMAAALTASASFATWDYFPVQEAGKGTVEGGLYYDKHHSWSQAGLNVGARYSVVQNLELSIQGWGFQFWAENDCNGCANKGDGFRDMALGFRYQLNPNVNIFADLHLPIGGDEVTNDEIAVYAGGQFATPINNDLKLGTEAGLFWGFEHDHNERGLEMHLGGELDYTIPTAKSVTPYLGMQIKTKITENTWEACDPEENKCIEKGDDSSGDMQFIIWVGASFAINQQLAVKGHLIVRSGDHNEMGGDASGLYVAADFNF